MFIRLKMLREKNNFTQSEVAKSIGISQSRYSLYENGKKAIPVRVLSNLANFYKTSIDFIIGDTDEIKRY